MSKMEALAGLVSYEACEGESVPCFLPNFWWPQASLGLLMKFSPCSFCLPSMHVCLLAKFPF